MISTPYVAVPPPRYGGTELVVWELVEGLTAAGHEVVLFTVGESNVSCETRRCFEVPVWPPDPIVESEHAAWAVGEIVADGGFDVVHAHIPSVLPLARFVASPVVYTIHHQRDETLSALYARSARSRVVAISRRQRELLPEVPDVEVVWHGLDTARYALGDGRGAPLFLGRLAREKGPHAALDAAALAGQPLVVAGRAHWKDHEYYAEEVAPRLAALASMGTVAIGEVNHDEKVPLLGAAPAVLFPIDWEEPFGLVLVESMLCGAPVLAFARGSAPELIEEGVTGFLCRDVDDMAARLRALATGALPFDRARCRQRASERFSQQRMIADYEGVYARALTDGRLRSACALEEEAPHAVGL